jgi:hypothetical protein
MPHAGSAPSGLTRPGSLRRMACAAANPLTSHARSSSQSAATASLSFDNQTKQTGNNLSVSPWPSDRGQPRAVREDCVDEVPSSTRRYSPSRRAERSFNPVRSAREVRRRGDDRRHPEGTRPPDPDEERDRHAHRRPGRPALMGHVGEYITAQVFDVQLERSAANKALDGFFASGPPAGRFVNVKWTAKHNGLLNVREHSHPDHYLVLAGPRLPGQPAQRSSAGQCRLLGSDFQSRTD